MIAVAELESLHQRQTNVSTVDRHLSSGQETFALPLLGLEG